MAKEAWQRFVGEHHCKLDEKNRAPVPASFRKIIERSGDRDLYLFPGTETCIFVFPTADWERFIEEKVEGLLMGPAQSRAFTRLLSAKTSRVTMDKSGRILLPEGAREMVEIPERGRIAFLGVFDRMEIWKEETWLEWSSSQESQYNSLADTVLGGGETATRP